MAIYRGTGTSGTTSDSASVEEVSQLSADAAQSATEAETSATQAASSAASASSSATSATNSATASAASASSASDSATEAASSASGAATSETNAAASETAAAASETAAGLSETNAATSATSAALSATSASTSATQAATSATAANAAKDAALAALDSFDDRYLGSKASDPTLDNDGNALLSGALYFNTTDDVMKVYDGAQWLAAYAQLSGALIAANNLSDVVNVTAARTNLGLGTAATTASTDYATAAQGALADSAIQPSDNVSTLTNDAGYLTSETSHADVVVDGDFASTGLMKRGATAGSYSIVTDNSTNWDTAYGWGDHALEGYITDYTVTEADVTAHQAALSITESQISDLSHYTDSDVDTHLNTSTATTDQLLAWSGTDYSWIDAPSGGGGATLELYAENPSTPTAPSATGTNAVAIGNGSTASGHYANSLGDGTASGNYSTAIGYFSSASGLSSFAAGSGASAGSDSSTAIGRNFSGGGSTTAVGAGAMALGGSYASGTDSFAAAIANNTSSYGATGANSIAIGRYNKATNSGSVAVGREYNTSSGVGSIVLGGGSNNSTGAYSVTSGYANTASASYTWATGQYASAAIIGKSARASGRFSVEGDAQSGHFVLRADTTDATSEPLTTNNGAALFDNQIILPNNSACSFSGTIIARQQAASGSDFAAWEIKGGAVRDGATTSTTLGSYNINILSKSTGAATWDVALSADTINGGIAITVTGAAATNIRWVATVNTSEVIYA